MQSLSPKRTLTVFVLVLCATVQANHNAEVQVHNEDDGYYEEEHLLEDVVPSVHVLAEHTETNALVEATGLVFGRVKENRLKKNERHKISR